MPFNVSVLVAAKAGPISLLVKFVNCWFSIEIFQSNFSPGLGNFYMPLHEIKLFKKLNRLRILLEQIVFLFHP